jgi:hypothetical protein
MKQASFLAILSICLLIFTKLLCYIQDYYGGFLISILEVLSYIGLLPFFIKLYKKQ